MIYKFYVSPLGWAVIICPKCGMESHTKPGKELLHKVLERACTCGTKYQLMLNTRTEHRKECSLPGMLLFAKNNIAVVLDSLSEIGASFEIEEMTLDVGGFYHLKIKIGNKWIEVLVKVIRFNNNMAGVQFIDPGYNERKMIESFLLSN